MRRSRFRQHDGGRGFRFARSGDACLRSAKPDPSRRVDGHERAPLSERKPGLSRCARSPAQGRAGARRQDESRGGKAPQAAARRAAEGGLRLPVGQRRQGRAAREILRAVRRQGHAPALLVHVRAELGQAVSVLHVADGWVRPHLVFGRAGRRVRRDRQGAGRTDQRVGQGARLVADPAAVRLRVAVPGGLQVPGRERRHAVAGDACVHEARRQDFPFLGHRGDDEPRRHGVAVLESVGLHAGGPAGPADAAAEIQERVFGEELFE